MSESDSSGTMLVFLAVLFPLVGLHPFRVCVCVCVCVFFCFGFYVFLVVLLPLV